MEVFFGVLAIVLALGVGIAVGYFLLRFVPSIKAKNAEKKADKIIHPL